MKKFMLVIVLFLSFDVLAGDLHPDTRKYLECYQYNLSLGLLTSLVLETPEDNVFLNLADGFLTKVRELNNSDNDEKIEFLNNEIHKDVISNAGASGSIVDMWRYLIAANREKCHNLM